MKDAVENTATGAVIHEPPIITMSIMEPPPAELAKRVGTNMGLYDQLEHPFRMYAAAALG